MNEIKDTTEMQTDPDVAELFAAPDVVKAFTVLGEACRQAAEGLGAFFQAVVDYWTAVAQGMEISQFIKTTKVRAALKEAPPRVRHLAKHGKKYRTRKKNINRALREYQRSK